MTRSRTAIIDARNAVYAREVEAKRRVAHLETACHKARLAHATYMYNVSRQQRAGEMREYKDAMRGVHERAAMANFPRATDADVVALSEAFNRRMCELQPEPRERSWFILFRHMDEDGSGLISYSEFSGMVRDELQLPPHELPERALKAVWLALDEDSSGHVSSGEFGAFMRRGEAVQAEYSPPVVPWQLRVLSERQRMAAEVRAQNLRLLNRGARAAALELPRATEAEIRELSQTLNRRMGELQRGEAVAGGQVWYRLYKHLDHDEAGQIGLAQFAGMVRDALQLPPHAVAEKRLREVWRALDGEASGFISCGEFGLFMRLGEGAQQQLLGWQAAGEGALPPWEQVALAKRRRGAAVRREAARRRGAHLMRGRGGVEAAADEEVSALSRRFNIRMAEVVDDARERSWLKLYRLMERTARHAGQLCYAEFAAMVRELLQLPPSAVGDAALKRTWLALDRRGDGFLSAGEFGAFMRRGEPPKPEPPAKGELAHGSNSCGCGGGGGGGGGGSRPGSAASRPGSSGRPSSARRGGGAAMVASPRASDDEMTALSELFNRRLCEVHDEPRERSWVKLFRQMDATSAQPASGLLGFDDFVTTARETLLLPEGELPERKLREAWRTLDAAGAGADESRPLTPSGKVARGEFGLFMRRGEAVHKEYDEQRPPWRERVLSERQQKAGAVRAQLDQLYHRDLKRSMEGEPRASDDEILTLSEALNGRMAELQAGEVVSWFKLFRHMDEDGSGLIDYAEFSRMVRDELGVPPHELPERALKAVWLALDEDSSGHITSGEFGDFMRRGEAVREPLPAKWVQRREVAARQRSDLEASVAAQAREQMVRAQRAAREVEGEAEMLQLRALQQALEHVLAREAAGCALSDKEQLLLERARGVRGGLGALVSGAATPRSSLASPRGSSSPPPSPRSLPSPPRSQPPGTPRATTAIGPRGARHTRPASAGPRATAASNVATADDASSGGRGPAIGGTARPRSATARSAAHPRPHPPPPPPPQPLPPDDSPPPAATDDDDARASPRKVARRPSWSAAGTSPSAADRIRRRSSSTGGPASGAPAGPPATP